jgi:hypothetical protein
VGSSPTSGEAGKERSQQQKRPTMIEEIEGLKNCDKINKIF